MFPSLVFKLEQPGGLQNASEIAALPFLSLKILAPRRVSNNNKLITIAMTLFFKDPLLMDPKI